MILILITLISIAQAAATPPAPSPEQFVRNLYQREQHATKADEEAFTGHLGAEAIYSPSLLELIRKDIRNTPAGDIPRLEGDPICNCQDSAGLIVSNLQMTPPADGHSDAVIALRVAGSKQRKITLHLLLTPAGWRIDDISTKDLPSLRTYLALN